MNRFRRLATHPIEITILVFCTGVQPIFVLASTENTLNRFYAETFVARFDGRR